MNGNERPFARRLLSTTVGTFNARDCSQGSFKDFLPKTCCLKERINVLAFGLAVTRDTVALFQGILIEAADVGELRRFFCGVSWRTT